MENFGNDGSEQKDRHKKQGNVLVSTAARFEKTTKTKKREIERGTDRNSKSIRQKSAGPLLTQSKWNSSSSSVAFIIRNPVVPYKAQSSNIVQFEATLADHTNDERHQQSSKRRTSNIENVQRRRLPKQMLHDWGKLKRSCGIWRRWKLGTATKGVKQTASKTISVNVFMLQNQQSPQKVNKRKKTGKEDSKKRWDIELEFTYHPPRRKERTHAAGKSPSANGKYRLLWTSQEKTPLFVGSFWK